MLVAFTALTPVIAALAVSFGALNISLLPVIGIIAGVAAAIAGIIAIVKTLDFSGETEADTVQREKITVRYFAMETLAVKTTEMYVKGCSMSPVDKM